MTVLRTSANTGGVVKLLVDSGSARSFDDADSTLRNLVLQVHVGSSKSLLPGGLAALLTIVNIGARTFRGGVIVKLEEDCVVSSSWGAGLTLSEAVEHFGGDTSGVLSDSRPTVVVGDCGAQVVGTSRLHPTCSGWSGGVVLSDELRLHESNGTTLAGALSGAICVSEIFQHAMGDPVAGRRNTGLSLWRPEMDWKSLEAIGPQIRALPRSLWILGLGHLGQAYCWILGLLPYPDEFGPRVVLQDFDRIDESNLATSSLASSANIGQLKTRCCAQALESIGFSTSIVERPFGGGWSRTQTDPPVALSGFDNYAARRGLDHAGFGLVVDAGLGSGAHNYLDILLHTFPAERSSEEVFTDKAVEDLKTLGAPYELEILKQIETGVSEEDARCGIVEVAGKAVGAAFVGITAACLVVSEVLRTLHGDGASSALNVNLGALEYSAQSLSFRRGSVHDVIYLPLEE